MSSEPNNSRPDDLDRTHDSVRNKSEVSKDHADASDATEITQAPSRQDQTGRSAMGRKTANPVEVTMASQQHVTADTGEEEFDLRTQTAGRQGLPAKIGRYEVRRLLGEGAFGQVFEARDPQLARLVAVKVAKSISGKTQVQRFLREARAAAQLRHPNVIPVYEYGEVDGENIIVYEYVAGETLKALIRREQSLPVEKAVEIIKQIADGLDYAHTQGIIHRDIKPENILIDAKGKPHVADFGCARTINDQTELTIEGSILGTPMYMSPEQASGKAKAADRRSDIWSIGVMLYEMVSGNKPFHGSLTDLLFWICNHDAKPLRKIHPAAPVDIETICTKCLQRDVDKRFATAGELSDELARFLRGEPIQSRRINPLQRIWMWARRNQAVASLSAAVAITLLFASIVSSYFAIKAYREQRSRALAQMNSIKTAEASGLPEIFRSMTPFRSTILPQLKEQLLDQGLTNGDRQRIRLATLNLETDSAQRKKLADEMLGDLLSADPDDFFICRESLEFHKNELKDQLWDVANDPSSLNSNATRFHASAALALYDPDSQKWNEVAPDVVGYLTSINQVEMAQWLPSLQPIREKLRSDIVTAFESESGGVVSERAAAIATRLFVDQVPFLVDLIPNANFNQIPFLVSALKSDQSIAVERIQSKLQNELAVTQKSNLIAASIQLNTDYAWNHFYASNDPTLANQLIETLGPTSTPFETLAKKLEQWETLDSDLLASILLSLGQYRSNQILQAQRKSLDKKVLSIFEQHDNARVHCSARWLLREFDLSEPMLVTEKNLRRPLPEKGKNWHVDMLGNTFVIFGPVETFEMGLNPTAFKDGDFDGNQPQNEPLHFKTIQRRFGICIHEVTIAHFEPFEVGLVSRYSRQLTELADADKTSPLYKTKKRLEARIKQIHRNQKRRAGSDKQLPVGDVDFYTSLVFCKWINEEQGTIGGLPTIEELNRYYDDSKVDLKLTESNLSEVGYRLPTSSEWEFACRGKTRTVFPFGNLTSLANRYAWYATNSNAKLQPVGLLKPGNTGLFDMVGNASEWCLDWYHEELPKTDSTQHTYVDFGPEFNNSASLVREYRGGSFADEVFDMRSSKRFPMRPINGFPRLGFRLARTYEAE